MGSVLAAIFIAGTLSAVTDWLLMGRLFREAQASYPEVWWPSIRDGDTIPAKLATALLGLLSATGVVLLCLVTGMHGFWRGLLVGFFAFIAGPPVVLLTAIQFVKMDWWIILAHTLAWASRMLIAGAVAGLILP